MNPTPSTLTARGYLQKQRGFLGGRRLALAALLVGQITSATSAAELLRDTFDDGVIPPRYSVFGGAAMVETGGKLRVEMFQNSGLTINTADLTGMACFSLEFSIPPSGWQVGNSMQVTFVATSGSTGQQFDAFEFLMIRPFWNRCRYEITQRDGNNVKVGFWDGRNAQEFPCPDASKVRFDWLSGDRFWIEVDGMALDTRMIRRPDQVMGSSNPFKHENDRIDFVKITRLPDGQRGTGDYTMDLDTLAIDSDHPGLGTPAVTLTPDFLDRGQVTQVNITTDEAILDPNLSVLDMGPDVLVQNFNVLTPTSAVATIQVDPRAVNAGEAIRIVNQQGGHRFGRVGAFDILPVGPVQFLLNQAATVQVAAPSSVSPNTPFSFRAIFDDEDDQFIHAVAVIMERATTAEVLASRTFPVDTSGDQPVQIEFNAPGLPEGLYDIVTVANDGIAEPVMVKVPLEVGAPSPAGRVPGGIAQPGIPLTVDLLANQDVVLTWGSSCLSSDTDYEIYEGAIGNYYSHFPRTCTTGGATTLTFTPAAGSTYYLVVPRNAHREGSYGLSGGSERPQGMPACLPQAVSPCP